jgi:transcriptional repressor NrdR
LFDENKLRNSIKKAAIDAGVNIEKNKDKFENIVISSIVTLKDNSAIMTRDIRENILTGLDKVESRVADSWRKFDDKYKSR